MTIKNPYPKIRLRFFIEIRDNYEIFQNFVQGHLHRLSLQHTYQLVFYFQVKKGGVKFR